MSELNMPPTPDLPPPVGPPLRPPDGMPFGAPATMSPPSGPMDQPPAPAVDGRYAVTGPATMVAPAAPAAFEPPADMSIAAVGLTKRYGTLHAVNQIDFYVPRGSVYGLIGPNGAGKSTLMSMAASLLLPSAGSILVEGHDPISEPTQVRSKIGYMPDGLGVYEGMNVQEYIEFFASAYRIPRDQWSSLTDSLLELVELEVKRVAPVNSLSRGMKQRLSLARALVHDPALLILDEPASGLDPRARIELRHLIENLHAMGKTILVSSHILSELQEVCTHVGIMEAGRLLASGSPAEILERIRPIERVRATFQDGTSELFDIVDGITKAELLRRLVLDDERQVVGFTDVSQGLEDVFLSVTQGIVQ